MPRTSAASKNRPAEIFSPLHAEILLSDAVDERRSFTRSIPHRAAGRNGRRDAVDVRLLRQRACVGDHKRLDLGRAHVAKILPRKDLDRVGAQTVDVGQYLATRDVGEADDGDHGGDSDYDTEHGQEGA
jgi:hypothetical protein